MWSKIIYVNTKKLKLRLSGKKLHSCTNPSTNLTKSKHSHYD